MQIVLFQTIQFSISKKFNCNKTFLFQAIQLSQAVLIQTILFSISIFFIYTQLNVETVLFQAIQFSISTQFSSIWAIDRTLSGITTSGQSGPGGDGNEGVLHIPQSSSWNIIIRLLSVITWTLVGGGVLPLFRGARGVFYCPSRLDKETDRDAHIEIDR